MTSVCCFLAVAIVKGWALHQMGFDNAFVHCDLEEELYMKMPLGFTSSDNTKCVNYKNLFMVFDKIHDNGSLNSHQSYTITVLFSPMRITYCLSIDKALRSWHY